MDIEKLFQSIKTIFTPEELQKSPQNIYAAGIIYKSKDTFLLVQPKYLKNRWILPLVPISKHAEDMVNALEEQLYSLFGIVAVVENIILYNKDTQLKYPDVCFFARYIGKVKQTKKRIIKKFFKKNELPQLNAVDTELFTYI